MAQATQEIASAFQHREDSSRVVKLREVIEMPNFHQTWGSVSVLEKCQLGLLMSAIRPRVIVETGVWKGATTKFISEFLQLNEISGTVYGFDLPEVIEKLRLSDSFFQSARNVELIGGTLPSSLSTWLETETRNVDLALIDANHSFYAVYSELSALAPHLSADGYIFCHDYGRPGTTFDRVMCAVNEFARRNGFCVLPFYSSQDGTANTKCEAAILHRPVKAPLNTRLHCWRKYYAEAYPRVARVWNSLRHRNLSK